MRKTKETWYILTEAFNQGDFSDKIHIHTQSRDIKDCTKERNKTIAARCSKPLFNEFDPNSPEDVTRYRQEQEGLLEVWERKVPKC